MKIIYIVYFIFKRANPKQTMPPTQVPNKSSNIPPFAIRDPFELDSSGPSLVPPLNPTSNHRSHHHQNDLYRFDGSHRHHRHSHPHQSQQFPLPMTNSTTNSPSYPSHKLNFNPSVYTQFKIHPDRIPPTPSSSSSSSSTTSSSSPSSYNMCRYPPTTDLALPIPVSSLSSHASSQSLIPTHTSGTSSRKTKVNIMKTKKKRKGKRRYLNSSIYF